MTTARSARQIDMTGRRFGRLVVKGLGEPNIQPNGAVVARWLCVCDCGNETLTASVKLRQSRTKSCGCWKSDLASARLGTHRQSASKEYMIWHTMIRRCTQPNNPKYHAYGARGIRVCDEWMRFEAFIADMGQKPTPQHQLDRVDNDGNYCKDNCRWALPITQANNTRRNVLVEIDGVERTIAEWARFRGVGSDAIYRRLYRGWDAASAVTKPFRR